MRFINKVTLNCLVMLLLFSVSNAQEESKLSLALPADDDMVCGLTQPLLIILDVTVQSSEKSYLNNLTFRDFEIYDGKELRDIEFFKFDELKNQYTIGFYQEDELRNVEWENIKVKVKLSKVEKNFGKFFITVVKGYTSDES